MSAPPATTWQGGQQQEYTRSPTGDNDIADASGNLLVDASGNDVVDNSVSESPLPASTWSVNDSQ